MCVVEAPDAAARRGAHVYGEILGVGAGGSGEPINRWPSSAAALARTMRAALEDAACAAEDIGAIYASANATRELDPLEAEAIAEVFDPDVPVTSIKGAVGEFGAVGAAAAIAALACGGRGMIAPTSGLASRDPSCRVNATAERRALDRPLVLINSFASGGTLYSLLMRIRPSGGRGTVTRGE